MTLLHSGEPIDPARDYAVAGWASVNEGAEGPPIWEVVESHIKNNPVIRLEENRSVRLAS
jgi:sulfur-oxidizing protein SoxB